MPNFAVATGGFIGAVLRYILGEWMGTARGFPVGTLVLNLVGSFTLMWLYTLTLERFPIDPRLRLGIGTGLLGAFTTFSTFSVDTWNLLSADMYGFALLYVILTLGGGLLCASLGYMAAGRETSLRFYAGWEEV